MLRWYSNATCQLDFRANSCVNEIIMQGQYSHIRLGIFEIIQECVTNDLKYGQGIAKWEIVLMQNQLTIQQHSQCKHDHNAHGGGHGTTHINQCVKKLGGQISQNHTKNYYDMKIVIPITSNLALPN